VTQTTVDIETADGVCRSALSVPDGEGPWPGLIMFSDAGGMRDTMRQMGDRLSSLGYVVLLPDFYYRLGPYDPVDMRTAFLSPDSAQRILGMMNSYSADMAAVDAVAFVDFLDSLPVTLPGGVGTTGYCMGGRLSLLAAGTLGPRVAAAASFHGGNLANEEDPDSPHQKAANIRAAIYVAAAVEDRSFPSAQKDLLGRSLSDAEVAHVIETYDALHGFAVPDNPSYDDAAAQRHWDATGQFFASMSLASDNAYGYRRH